MAGLNFGSARSARGGNTILGFVQSRTTKARHFYWGRKARRNGPIFVGSSSALKKESIAHFSVFLANCLWHRQILKVKKCKY